MHLSKVLMDGGSSLNILYVDTLEAMGIPQGCLRESLFPFYGILPGMKAYPVSNIDLPVTFGSKANFRTETLTFEVVDWKGVYHAILGRPAYAKFMAYISSCEYYDLATTMANSTELGQLRATTPECRPDPGKPSQASAFVSTDKTKTVVVDDADPTKTVRIGSQLPAK
ncbi:uncharacterized protein LOC120681051 [Panicum virgatum]|uniref:uncharacterized protein LOC120681051 n=1 Tax=Panicum virgatum TaxID=38727 RepID=UPI0019D6826C|nr:uncharacterized protein LOC120681051 [Panicum virgatum]